MATLRTSTTRTDPEGVGPAGPVAPDAPGSTPEGGAERDGGSARIIVDEKSALYLGGTTLDFVDTLQESGFKINNPNASNTCGCGDSFAA